VRNQLIDFFLWDRNEPVDKAIEQIHIGMFKPFAGFAIGLFGFGLRFGLCS